MDRNKPEQRSVACDYFDQFVSAGTCKSIFNSFQLMLHALDIKTTDHRHFYRRLRSRLTHWKAQSLWAKLDKRASCKEYKGEPCANTKVLIIGAGPCGLRMAIEVALLGGRAVVVEKREHFSRNNVLHLWPFLITDLNTLGAKKFFGRFCAGAIDHISIRQLQCILLKVALMFGVEIYVGVTYEDLLEPPDDQESNQQGWRCVVSPKEHPVSEYEFDVLVGADGKRNTVAGFKRREFRGKLAIAITANFINSNTSAEAMVEEISGVAFIFNQKFFLDLKAKTAIDLENIVYYKDDTHYFVMTAKKQSLLHKGVLKADYRDTVELLDRANVNHDKLLAYAIQAADVSTNNQLPKLEYAINHYGQPDVAMFDFTSMFAAYNSSRVVERNDHKLLIALVGDSLLEPFWPIGSGCARGFLGVFDTAFMIRRWASGKMTPLQILAERESIYQRLSQTTPENLNKNFAQYAIDPITRYPNVNTRAVSCDQVRQHYDCGDNSIIDEIPTKKARNDYLDSYSLLRWCQRVLNTGLYRNVHVVDFTMSWKSGLALSALVHAFRPDLIDFNSLMESDVVSNNEQLFDIANRELGIPPVMSGQDMSTTDPPDKLTMIAYLSQFYEVFKMSDLPKIEVPALRDGSRAKLRSPAHKTSFLNRLSHRFSKAKRRKDKEDEENDQPNISFGSGSKKSKELQENGDIRLVKYNHRPIGELSSILLGEEDKPYIKKTNRELQETKVNVSAMAEILVSKFKGVTEQPFPRKVKPLPGLLPAAKYDSEFCYFCKKRVYIMERMAAEGIFFHSSCLKCDFCGVSLRLQNYSYRKADTGEDKFYCYRHYWHANNRSRKRYYDEEEVKSEKLPSIKIDESPPIRDSNKMTPKKIPAPLDLPVGVFSQPKKTPERVEFENSIDSVHEETEEEQTEYNLRASLSSDTLLDEEDEDSDSESSDDDDIVMLDGEDPKDPLTWAEACKLAETWKLSHSQENLLAPVKQRDYDDSTEEDDEDSEYESDTEEADDSGEESSNRPQKSQLHISTSPVNSPTSPSIQMAAGRASFFSAPPQVIRLDPFQMFGMGKKGTDPTTVQEINADDDKREIQLRKPSESEDSETVNDKEPASLEESDDIIKLENFPMDSGESTTMSTATSTDNLSEGSDSEDGSETENKELEIPDDKLVSEEGSDLENKTMEVQDEKFASENILHEEAKIMQRQAEKSTSETGSDTEDINSETKDNEYVSDDKIAEDQIFKTPNEERVLRDDLDTKEQAAAEDLRAPSPAEDDNLVSETEQEDYDQNAVSRAMELLLVEIDTKPSLSDDDLLLSIEDTHDPHDVDEEESDDYNDDDEVFISEKLVAVEGKVDNGEEMNDDEENLSTMDTERQVLRSIQLMGDNTSELDGDTLLQVLQSIQAMGDSGDAQLPPCKEEEVPDFQHIDEAFITMRKISRRGRYVRRQSSDVSNSSFTISTPSDSIRSSISSLADVVQSNQKYLNSGDDDEEEALDADMLTDYQMTMSQALADEEGYDDNDNRDDDSQNNTLISDEPCTDQQDSSVYLTPNASIEQPTSIKSDSLEISHKLISSLSEDGGAPPKELDLSPIAGQSGDIFDDSMSDVANSSIKTGSEKNDLKLNQLDLSPIAVEPHPMVIVEGEDENKVASKGNIVVTKSENSAKDVDDQDRNTPMKSPIRRKLPELTTFIPSSVSDKKVKSLSPVVKLGDELTTSTPKISDFTSVKSSKFPDQVEITPMEKFKTPLKNSKFKVPVDWSRIVESSGTVSDVVCKKKIPVDSKLKISISKNSTEDVEDIPFADDTEVGDDVFYTPRTSVKSMANKPQRSAIDKDVKKRILPTPPDVDNNSNLHLRQVKNEEMEKAREVVREKARLKSDEELGILNKSYGMVVARSNTRSKDSDTQSTPRGSSTSDVLSDSDESRRCNAQTTENAISPQNGKMPTALRKNKNKKDKSKTSRNNDTSVSDSDSSRTNSLKKDKKKSILSMFRPKTPEKVVKEKVLTPIKTDIKTTPKTTGDKGNQKRPKSAAKSDKKKEKKKKRKSGLKDCSGNELNENMKDLRIKSVFYTPDMDLSKYREKTNVKNRIGIAPKAEVDEFSDSGESLMSTDTQVSKRSRGDRQHLTEEELNERIAKRIQSTARRQQKQKELRRMRRAQEIQRKLEEVEVKQKDLAEEGTIVERKLREGAVGESEDELMKQWFGLVKNKNDLLRYESELMVQRKELELLDRQSRLEQEIRERMSIDDADKSEEYMMDEKRILDELLEVVEERDSLVLLTDEDRLREQEEDKDLESVMQAKGFLLTPAASRKAAAS